MESPQHAAGSPAPEQEHVPLTPEQQQEAKQAKRCFAALERLANQMVGYPPGHPAIETAIDALMGAFNDYFQLTDRLSTSVHPHSLKLFGTEAEIWETEEPKDYCFVLSRDGIFLIHILAGIERAELKRFTEVLTYLVEHRNDPDINAVSVMFDANFGYISYDALDESLAALAGIDTDTRNRDTKEEKEQIEELFNNAFEDQDGGQDMDSMQGNYEIRIQNPAARMKKIELGARQFLALDDDAQRELTKLKRGFIEHRELEHREGEILSAILGARPKGELKEQTVEQIGEVMSALLTTDQPWEALTFLKLIHTWRDQFEQDVIIGLKDVVQSCFTERQIQELLRLVTREGRKERRMILQMLNALHLEDATGHLVRTVGWDLDEETRQDILRYVRERSRYGFEFFDQYILEVDAAHVDPLLDILKEGMPHSRPTLMRFLTNDDEGTPPPVKTKVMDLVAGTWESPPEIRDVLVPLTQHKDSELRLRAIRALCESAPQHAFRVLEPMFDDGLRKRPDKEVAELAKLFVEFGKGKAIKKLEELVRRRGLTTSEAERELAVTIARSLIRVNSPDALTMLESVAKDRLVPKRIREACQEIVDMLNIGR